VCVSQIKCVRRSVHLGVRVSVRVCQFVSALRVQISAWVCACRMREVMCVEEGGGIESAAPGEGLVGLGKDEGAVDGEIDDGQGRGGGRVGGGGGGGGARGGWRRRLKFPSFPADPALLQSHA